MEIIRNLKILGKTDKPIVTDVFYKPNNQPKPVVIFCHGYKGYKDWGAWDLMAKAYAEQGFFFVKFNFSHNGGTPENPIDFPDLEAFANDNYTIQLSDLEQVLQWINHNSVYAEEIDSAQINLIGHSRGGGIVLLKAAESDLITKVVTLAGVSDYASRFPKGQQLKQWQAKGVYYVENSRTHQQMPHYIQFYDNFIAHQEQLNIQRAVESLRIPQLIIHAKDDSSVSIKEAYQLHRWNPKSQTYFIEQGAHTFGAKQPWQSQEMPESLADISAKTCQFLAP